MIALRNVYPLDVQLFIAVKDGLGAHSQLKGTSYRKASLFGVSQADSRLWRLALQQAYDISEWPGGGHFAPGCDLLYRGVQVRQSKAADC